MPDAGSNEYEKHKELKDLNIDCLVLDHHDAPYESEFALVVNNQLSERYENKDLSGVGIVWQLCRAMDHFSIEESNRPADSYLDLVAVGPQFALVAPVEHDVHTLGRVVAHSDGPRPLSQDATAS